MIKFPATLILLLTSVGTAVGASSEFIFFNKLGLLILLAVIIGGLLALGGYVIAGHLVSRLRRPQPVRVERSRDGRPNRSPARHRSLSRN